MHQARHLQGSFHSNVPGVRNGEMELFARHLKTRRDATGVMRKGSRFRDDGREDVFFKGHGGDGDVS